MKHRLFIIAGMLGIGLVVGAVFALTTSQDSAVGMCAKTGPVHSVVIQDDKAGTSHIEATRCDVLKVTNLDPTSREIAFGPHEDHVPYNGISEKLLGKGQSFSVVLNQAGTYRVHDHIHDEVQATFTVNP